MEVVSGFSKLPKEEKINLLVNEYFSKDSEEMKDLIASFWHKDHEQQKKFDEFSENTLTNFYFPYGVIPNFLINGKSQFIPLVTEESSVVAAAARSAKFWFSRGGFHAKALGTTKVGQVHFTWKGETEKLNSFFKKNKEVFLKNLTPLTESMDKRGGGIKEIKLIDKTNEEPGLYQILATFETCEAMGANFINTVLEALGKELQTLVANEISFSDEEKNLIVIMAILSNYTPECKVRAWVECPISDLQDDSIKMGPEEFVERFRLAIKISKIDEYRATTHNKGIMNGIDGVILATGNDFRAVEACAHAYATKDGKYQGLTDLSLENGMFKFSLEMPLALGTVGGLTKLHPMADFSLDLLNRPNARKLMEIAATVGLAQTFAAVRSLVTSGIQKGHMKMHLLNILNSMGATEEEREEACTYFINQLVSYKAVKDFLNEKRIYQ